MLRATTLLISRMYASLSSLVRGSSDGPDRVSKLV